MSPINWVSFNDMLKLHDNRADFMFGTVREAVQMWGSKEEEEIPQKNVGQR